MSLDFLPPKPGVTLSALAFDYGTQKIGVAFGQSLTGTAQAIKIIKARDGIPDWQDIETLIAQWEPDIFVVGLPYNLDGSQSELSVRATKFANRLHGRFGKPSFGMDERLSSKEAIEIAAAENGYGKKKAAIDDIAAQIILQNWFNEYRDWSNKNI
ncbi:MAG: putative Holliday junction resolvase [Pseudohongiellaceae bacterium]|jgi:putative Holliday junction resolvase